MNQSGSFPIAIDSTIRSTWRSCPQKFNYSHVQHWATTEKSIHLRAGGAFAAGMEAARRAFWEQHLPQEDCIAIGAIALLREYEVVETDWEEGKSPDNMLLALDDYFRHYGWATDVIQPLIQNGKAALEFTFALEIPGIVHPETKDPLLYSGRFDMLGQFNNALYVVDEKTTVYMGQQWRRQWMLRSQLTGYVWAARQYGYDVAGALIRGVSVQKTQIKHETVPEPRPQWMVDRWLFQLRRDCLAMIEAWREGYYDYALDHACADFGGCAFLNVCSSNNPNRWLEANYVKSEWTPLRLVGEA